MGREADVAAVTLALRYPDSPLLTITGRSGAGKSRLALEVAARLEPTLAGGVAQVDIASIEHADLIAPLLAAALDLRLVAGEDPEAALRHALAYWPTLLIADDLDAVPGAAQVLLDLVSLESGTRILATAASPLRMPGEQVFRLGPLALPDPNTPAAQLTGSPAVALFCDRAAAVDHTFRLSGQNARAVLDLCRRLDGLPLAIELAAARSAALNPAAQLAMLERAGSLDLGPRRSAEASERHADLRTAIAWSHRLAGTREQALLRRLGAFGGSFDLEAITAVCTGPDLSADDLLDALVELVDIHLVEPDPAAGEGRFRLLPTIAEYAREQLAAAGEGEAVRERAIKHALELAAATRRLPDIERVRALERDREHLDATLALLVERGDAARGLALTADLGLLRERNGYFPVIRAWTERLLALADEPGADVPNEVRARALAWAAQLDVESGAALERRELIARRCPAAVELARGTTPDTLLMALWATVNSVFVTRDIAGASAAAQEGMAVAAANDLREWLANFESMTAAALNNMGDSESAAQLATMALAHARSGFYPTPFVRAGWLLLTLPPGTLGVPDDKPTIGELLAATRESGDVAAETWLRGGTAILRMVAGDITDGAVWSVGSLELARRTGSWFAAAFPMVALALAAAAEGDLAMVARLHASVTRAEAAVMVSLAHAGPRYQALVAQARGQLGPAAFDRILAESIAAGWDASITQALDYAVRLAGSLPAQTTLAASPAAPTPAPEEATGIAGRLTPRELEVLRELAKGHSNNEIAGILGLRPKTVMHHSVSIYGKLAVRGRSEATAWAYRHGIAGGRLRLDSGPG